MAEKLKTKIRQSSNVSPNWLKILPINDRIMIFLLTQLLAGWYIATVLVSNVTIYRYTRIAQKNLNSYFSAKLFTFWNSNCMVMILNI